MIGRGRAAAGGRAYGLTGGLARRPSDSVSQVRSARRALPGYSGLGGARDRARRRGGRVNDGSDRRGGRSGRRGHRVGDRLHGRRGLGGGGGDGVDGLLHRRASATRGRARAETSRSAACVTVVVVVLITGSVLRDGLNGPAATGSVAWVTVPTVPMTTGSVAWVQGFRRRH